jgi:hypothetical protein
VTWSHSPRVDKLTAKATNAPMIEVGAFARGRGRTFVASVAACLLLLKALVVVLAGAEIWLGR